MTDTNLYFNVMLMNPDQDPFTPEFLQNVAKGFNIAALCMLVPGVLATGAAVYTRLSTGEVPEDLANIGMGTSAAAVVFGGLSLVLSLAAKRKSS